jgi:dipeptidyl aminopeptidase/acylaminoacyl peptidase
MPRPLRTRFAKDIVTEFLPPARAGKKNRVIILCDGMPSVPKKQPMVEWLSKKGFWVFYPRYRGSWESGGTFLKHSPEKDVLDIIDGLSKPFTSIVDKKKYRVRADEIFIIGGSFGGPAAILVSRDPRVKKVLAVCPVIDFRKLGKAEPIDWLETFVHEAFGNGYRFGKKEWTKLKTGKFYSPVYHQNKIDGSKIFMVHAKDDDVVGYREVAKFADVAGARLIMLKKGGHLSTFFVLPKYWKQIAKFFKD